MKKEVIILPEAENDIEEIKDVIIFISKSKRTALNYVEGLRTELKRLSLYGASLSPYTRRNITNRYGAYIRRANYKKLAIFFYIEDNYIFVRKIMFSHTISRL